MVKKLDDVALDDDFESPNQEKGLQVDGLPEDMNEDSDSGVHPSSKGCMVKETFCNQKKKKKGTKRDHIVDNSSVEEKENTGQGYEDDIQEVEGTIPPPDTASEFFTHTLSKEADGVILKGVASWLMLLWLEACSIP